ncbi:undecaprenyldiphospho-muramoylpentapeptide beta-N-acetylglucosaminyltransferase [Acidipila sp. EB88]|nr:undecaprenyldiphospho-muramoylpentapeptide beta-N-acetylglucosaminyltransferase [Acidipila sp. EB88]
MRVLIAGGGTGGHIIPALAIATALETGPGGAELLFLGTSRGLESRLVPQAGYRLELIEVGQLKGVSLATRARTLLDLPRAVLRARALLRSFKPDVVVGVGGYASGPAMAAAVLGGVPTLAFEPNAAPGLANRLVGKRVSAAAVNFAPAARFFRNARVTGIPVRGAFFSLPTRDANADQAPELLVFGGSQGARALNRVMPEVLVRLLAAVPGLRVLHQAGARAAEETRRAFAATGADPGRWQVSAFVDDMPARFGAADLVLARSGASTVAELCAAGKPSLLVPFPLAADDHQRRNAEELAARGAAVVVLEPELTADRLLQELVGLLGDEPRLARMAGAARALARPHAAEEIATMVRELRRK